MNKPTTSRRADGSESCAKPLHRRVTLSLPAPLAHDIGLLATRLRISQSAMLTELLSEPIRGLCEIINELPPAGATPEHVRRAKGRSVALIKGAVDEASALLRSEVLK